jgi:peptidoglycan/LPS O-acetylase OafA/YrhL
MGSLRFLLALAVAGGHAASMFGFAGLWILPGSRAVQIFYIISGFLMAMILNEKYPNTPLGNWIFYRNRAAKIFAPYLVILTVTILLCLLSKSTTGNALLLQPWFNEPGTMTFSTWAFAVLTNVFIVGQEWGYLLIYRAGSLLYSLHATTELPIEAQFTIIGPAWTLSIELMFYAIAPFILRRNLLLIVALALTSHGLRFFAYHAGYYGEATNYRFFPFELSLFLYGSICFRLSRLLPNFDLRLSATVTAAVVLTIISLPQYLLEHQYQFYFCIGFLLPILFDFSRRTGWDRSLGDLSYPLYLVHWPVIAFLATLTMAVQPSSLGTMWVYPWLAIAASIGTAILINRRVVMPVDDWRQNKALAMRQKPTLFVGRLKDDQISVKLS